MKYYWSPAFFHVPFPISPYTIPPLSSFPLPLPTSTPSSRGSVGAVSPPSGSRRIANNLNYNKLFFELKFRVQL